MMASAFLREVLKAEVPLTARPCRVGSAPVSDACALLKAVRKRTFRKVTAFIRSSYAAISALPACWR